MYELPSSEHFVRSFDLAQTIRDVFYFDIGYKGGFKPARERSTVVSIFWYALFSYIYKEPSERVKAKGFLNFQAFKVGLRVS